MDLIEAWSKTKRALQEDIGDAAYEAWINRLQPQENNPGVLTLGASDEFSKNWIAKNYLERIEEFLKKFAGGSIKIELCVKPAALKTDNEPAKNDPFPEKPLPLLNLNPRYTFENFIVGSSNRFSHAASVAVSESPAKVYNPLFIYGGVGLGKTHLMQAICHSILKRIEARISAISLRRNSPMN